jgi:cell division septation protein DedD
MKNRIMACITASLLVFTGASVWEGAASIAPQGELPEEGFYAATNSFPRNTVVDITNLETGQSIRVIVAAGLETPGLLAVLSRDAAGMIGIRSRSIGRIRMTQPSDPVAFSRFTEGLASSGDPDYDPRALISADPLALTYTQSPPDYGIPAAPSGGGYSPPDYPAADGGEEESGPWYDEIVDLPGFDEGPGFSEADAGVRQRGPEPVYPREETVLAEGPPDYEIIETADPWEIPGGEESPALSETSVPETNQPPSREAGPDMFIAAEPDIPPAAEPEPPLAAEPVPAAEEDYEFTLIPAEERVPEEAPRYEIPPELVISPIPEGSPPQAAGPEPEPVMDESRFVAPLESLYAAPPAAVPPPLAPIAPPLPEIFSVPLIQGLEQGKYYLQIGAFSRTDPVEALISKVGNGYPLAVQNGGTEEKPLYRLLIGPVNLGESGALLQRFKSIGYRDVFVRKGG